MRCTRGKVVGNEFGGDWGRQDFEEFVVAKVEQPA